MTTIDTRLGKINGLDDGSVMTFLGVRYAEPPVGTKRFLPPTMVSPWKSTADATQFPNRPMQPNVLSTMGQPVSGKQDEDCLFLNIYTPSVEGQSRPVLVWIHGGSFTGGTANEYDGSVLAQQGDVVVVTINYRLGAFGFLNLEPLGEEFAGSASNGIRDQILALEWVRENIADYGGDPGNVTLFGESAGGTSILAMLAAPSADGLYHKAIAHSALVASQPPENNTDRLAEKLAVEKSGLGDKLRAMSAEEVLDLGISAGVFIDGMVITRSTYDAIREKGEAGVPLITGTNHDEGRLFTGPGEDGPAEHYAVGNRLLGVIVFHGADPTDYITALNTSYPKNSARENHEQIWTDMFRRPCIGAAERATAAGPGGWLYRFDYEMPKKPGVRHLGATHASEMAFTFNTFANSDSHGFTFHDRSDPVTQQLALHWSGTILAMAKTGNPNGAGLPEWPAYDSETRQSMILDAEPGVEQNVDASQQKTWGDS